MDLEIIQNVYAQLGFFGLFSLSGWAVAYLLYKANKELMAKYAELMERVLEQNAEVKALITKLNESLNCVQYVEDLLKEYLKGS